MYKVFINDKVICFTNSAENCNEFSHGLVLNFFHKSITHIIIDLLNNDSKIELIAFVVKDYEADFKTFQEQFILIKAAGGIVKNNLNETLFIFRLEKWDLPKGKIEVGEEIKEAAVREVEEECGITDLIVNSRLNDTFHIYKLKDQYILKQTYWYKMQTTYNGELVPQTEENITKVEWLNNNQVKEIVFNNTYSSIKEFLIANDF